MNEDMEKSEIDPLQRKIFYLFENDKNNKNIKGYAKKKSSKSSDGHSSNSKPTTKSSEIQTEFSLFDIAQLTPLELSNKIFTYDKKLLSGDLSKINEVGNIRLEEIIQNLKCMKGIEK